MSETEGGLIESRGNCPAEEARKKLLFNIRGYNINESEVKKSFQIEYRFASFENRFANIC